ncbi:MAG: N-acetylglucosamine-6-phosphate deacetylase [Alphaproteobacteria bacterium]|nr:N-acetylglucosamine-6-phosphate deacetylase [Alphaproteobacteria bacterium]
MTPPSFALTEAIIFTGEAFVEGQTLLIQEGKIIDLCQTHAIPDAFIPIACAGQILTAGYVDCQVNGGDNRMIDSAMDNQGLLAIAACHAQKGTTSFLPTCITTSPAAMKHVLEVYRHARRLDAGLLGIHFEGPHINVEKKGAHPAEHIRPLSEEDFDLYQKQGDEVMRVTLAPECVTPKDIEKLTAQGVLVSMGHSMANAAQAKAAFDSGAHSVTHWMNTMPPITARDPGLSGFALDEKNCWLSFICDLQHLDPIMVRLAVKAKEGKNIFMVSDASSPAGADEPKPCTGTSINVTPQGLRCVNEQGTLAGSLLTLGQTVPLAIAKARLDPALVLRMCSTLPAQYLGLDHILGKLLPGYQADVLALDHSFTVQKVWKSGMRSVEC